MHIIFIKVATKSNTMLFISQILCTKGLNAIEFVYALFHMPKLLFTDISTANSDFFSSK